MTLNVVEQQIIPLRTNSEELGIDVYRMPSGEIRVGGLLPPLLVIAVVLESMLN